MQHVISKNLNHLFIVILLIFILLLLSTISAEDANAEYADVVLNKNSDKEGVRPVIFPHWFHRIRFQCRVCHQELGFEMRAGSNEVTMDEIIDGKFCGACHNGEIAWSVENCDLCHSALHETKSSIKGGHRTMGPGYW